MRLLFALCLPLSVWGVTLSTSTYATVLFSQPWPGGDGTGAVNSDLSSPVQRAQQVADNFILINDGVLTDLMWWGTYAETPTRFFTGPPPGSSVDFELRIFEDASGNPSISPLHQVPVVAGLSNLGPCCGGFLAFELTATLGSPIPLLGNTPYWISLVEADPNFLFLWSKTGEDGDGLRVRNSDIEGWRADIGDETFVLNGTTAIPEPTSLRLACIGLFWIPLLLWRRRHLSQSKRKNKLLARSPFVN